MKKNTRQELFEVRKPLLEALVACKLPPELICQELKIRRSVFKKDLKKIGADLSSYAKGYSDKYCIQLYVRIVTRVESVTGSYEVDRKLGKILSRHLELQKIFDYFWLLFELGGYLGNSQVKPSDKGYAWLFMDAHKVYAIRDPEMIWNDLMSAYREKEYQTVPSSVSELRSDFLRRWANYYRQNLGTIWPDDFNPRELLNPLIKKLLTPEELLVVECRYQLQSPRQYSWEELCKRLNRTDLGLNAILKEALFKLEEYFESNSVLGIIRVDPRMKQ